MSSRENFISDFSLVFVFKKHTYLYAKYTGQKTKGEYLQPKVRPVICLPCHLRTAALILLAFFPHLVYADLPLETNYLLPVCMLN